MENQNLLLLAQKVSRSEATTELADYWQKRYELILLNNLFTLSDKTSSQVLHDQVVDRPSTPFGDLVLMSHLDVNGVLDEIRLQTTIETAVRLLDATLDVINFNEESKFIVSQYRKIGLGFLDTVEFLESNIKGSELEAIDHLGNLISNSSYRASEALAEEKKACLNWSKINKHLRAKSFELWFTADRDNRANGLLLSQNYDAESILQTNYEIIPRRNSHVLLLPPDLEWQIWSDRDESSVKTIVTPFIHTVEEAIIDQASNIELLKNAEIEMPIFDATSNEVIAEDFQPLVPTIEDLQSSSQSFLESVETPKDLEINPEPDTNETEEVEFITFNQPESEVDMSMFEPLPEQELVGHSLLSSDSSEAIMGKDDLKLEESPLEGIIDAGYLNDEIVTAKEEITSEHNDFLPQSEELIEPEANHSSQPNLETEVEVPELVYEPIKIVELEAPSEPLELETHTQQFLEAEARPMLDVNIDNSMEELVQEPVFAIGELVRIVRADDPYFGKIYQVLDHLPPQQEEPYRYQLIGGKADVSNTLWSEHDLELIDLDILLDEINLVSDNEKSLESDLVNNLEEELNNYKNEVVKLESEVQKLEIAMEDKEQEKYLDRDKIIQEYVVSTNFTDLINTKVNQRLQQLSLNSQKSKQSSTLSTLQMMRKYQSK